MKLFPLQWCGYYLCGGIVLTSKDQYNVNRPYPPRYRLHHRISSDNRNDGMNKGMDFIVYVALPFVVMALVSAPLWT